MKRVIPLLALIGSLFLALLVFGGGFAAGQQNPAITPTPTPTPVPPAGWPVGVPFSEELLKNGLDRLAPVVPSVPFTITVKTDGSGKCEIMLEGHEYLPDYALSLEAMKSCNALSSKAIAAKKEVDLKKLDPAPIKSTIKTDPFGGCEVTTGDSELARGCFGFSREGMANLHPALPMPLPMPAPSEPISISIAYGDFLYEVTTFKKADQTEPGQVLTFTKISTHNGFSYAKDLYINDIVESLCGIWIWGEKLDALRISYNCKYDGTATFQVWTMVELFN